jgi:hypothetical protein
MELEKNIDKFMAPKATDRPVKVSLYGTTFKTTIILKLLL